MQMQTTYVAVTVEGRGTFLACVETPAQAKYYSSSQSLTFRLEDEVLRGNFKKRKKKQITLQTNLDKLYFNQELDMDTEHLQP